MAIRKGKRAALGPASASVTNEKASVPIANANKQNATPKPLSPAILAATASHPFKTYGRMLLQKIAHWNDPESDDPLIPQVADKCMDIATKSWAMALGKLTSCPF